MAIPAAREPGPLVTLVRNWTEAKVDPIGFVVARMGDAITVRGLAHP